MMIQTSIGWDLESVRKRILYNDMLYKLMKSAERRGCPVHPNMDLEDHQYGYLGMTDEGYLFIATSKDIEKDIRMRCVTVAHEIGHLIDMKKNHKNDPQFFFEWCKLLQYQSEYAAWDNSIELLRREGFHEWDWWISKCVAPHLLMFGEKDKVEKDATVLYRKAKRMHLL